MDSAPILGDETKTNKQAYFQVMLVVCFAEGDCISVTEVEVCTRN